MHADEVLISSECWQSDFTHYPLASGRDTEVLTWLDDHSRYALPVTAHARVTGPMARPIVLLAFRAACGAYGVPASTLTDNGMVFTTRLSGGKGGRNALEHELRRLGITQKNGKPNRPQTQGNVESGCYGMVVATGGSVAILAACAEGDQSDWPGLRWGQIGALAAASARMLAGAACCSCSVLPVRARSSPGAAPIRPAPRGAYAALIRAVRRIRARMPAK